MKSKQKKNTRIFLFLGQGKKFRIRIANGIVLLVIGLWIGTIIHQDKIQTEEIKMDAALQLFVRIDDLAHQQFTEMEARGNPSGFTGFEEFDKIDNDFHMANTLKEKFIQAKKMDIFFHKMDTYLHQVGGLTSTGDLQRDNEYHAIDSIFDVFPKIL